MRRPFKLDPGFGISLEVSWKTLEPENSDSEKFSQKGSFSEAKQTLVKQVKDWARGRLEINPTFTCWDTQGNTYP